MKTKETTMTVKLERHDVIGLMLLCADAHFSLNSNGVENTTWLNLHTKLKEQLEKFDAE